MTDISLEQSLSNRWQLCCFSLKHGFKKHHTKIMHITLLDVLIDTEYRSAKHNPQKSPLLWNNMLLQYIHYMFITIVLCVYHLSQKIDFCSFTLVYILLQHCYTILGLSTVLWRGKRMKNQINLFTSKYQCVCACIHVPCEFHSCDL